MFAQNHGSESAALKSTCWLSCWHFEGFWLDFTLVLSNSLTTQEGKRVYTLVASHCVVVDALICIHNMRVQSKPLDSCLVRSYVLVLELGYRIIICRQLQCEALQMQFAVNKLVFCVN
jgi:hypothetical protein